MTYEANTQSDEKPRGVGIVVELQRLAVARSIVDDLERSGHQQAAAQVGRGACKQAQLITAGHTQPSIHV